MTEPRSQGPPPVVAEWLQTLVPSRDFWERAYAAHAGFTVMDLLASVLLLGFIRIGRPLYIGTLIAGEAAVRLYVLSLEQARAFPDEPTLTKMIDLAGRLIERGRTEQAEAYLRDGRAEAVRCADTDSIEKADQFSKELSA